MLYGNVGCITVMHTGDIVTALNILRKKKGPIDCVKTQFSSSNSTTQQVPKMRFLKISIKTTLPAETNGDSVQQQMRNSAIEL